VQEADVRRALGLDAPNRPSRANTPAAGKPFSPGRHRHRFVNDGEVPVVRVQSRPDQPATNRPDPAAAALQDERAARERAERSLLAAQGTIRELQTKLAHVTLARDEAVAALQQTQEQLATVRAQLPAEPPAATPPVRRRGRPPKSAAAAKPAAKPRQRAPKPVKWWIKGWRDSLPK
jgi:hypothetical protein